MRLALVTTTINVPRVLSLYRAIGPEVHFFIAGDRKSPGTDLVEFLQDVPFCTYLSVDHQRTLGFAVTDLIPENCIQRRNIATLAALQWGADVIVSIDDDNLPIGQQYFEDIRYAFRAAHYGLQVSNTGGWFDPGQLLTPLTRQRGVPYDIVDFYRVDPITNAKVGVVAGTILGDSDTDAVTRLSRQHAPVDVHSTSALLDSGVTVEPGTWTVFNSQNTAVLRELVPLWFMWPHVGRYDDVFASMVVQRFCRERGLVVRHGRPFVWQQRNPHNLLRDLDDELFGMRHTQEFAEWLASVLVNPDDTAVAYMREIVARLALLAWFPPAAVTAARAWCDDCDAILNSQRLVPR